MIVHGAEFLQPATMGVRGNYMFEVKCDEMVAAASLKQKQTMRISRARFKTQGKHETLEFDWSLVLRRQ